MWDDDNVPDTGIDDRLAAGTCIRLACLVRLDRMDDLLVTASHGGGV